MKAIPVLLAALASGAGPAPGGGPVVLDLHDMGAWQARASEQVEAVLRRDPDGSACLEYDFHSVSGYAVLRQVLPVQWPAAFALQLRLKARGAVNDFQVKLLDASGDNVWWVNRPGFPLPRSPTGVTFKSRHFSFAWGPTADRRLVRTQSMELVIAAEQGGKGALCVSRVRVQEREPDPAVWPEPLVRRQAGTLDLDYRRTREFNGLTLQWPGPPRPESYDVLASEDAQRWRLLRRVQRSSGGFEALFLPESEARHLRIRLRGARAAPRVELRDGRRWPDLNAALSELAAHAPRGHVPRAFLGEQNYWTLVGVDGGGERSALLSEDGALEVGRGGFSVEPAVLTDGGRLVTWADVQLSHTLREGYLPMPEVGWQHGGFELRVAAAAEGPAGAPRALVRYALTNTGDAARAFTLLLAVRPWQVNPPQQFLNTPGGARRIERLRWQAPQLSVNGAAGPCFTEAPSRVTAVPGAAGIDLHALLDAAPLRELSDTQGQASALLRWELRLSPGETRVVTWSAPLGGASSAPSELPQAVDERLDRVAAGWRARLNRAELNLPASFHHVPDTLRTALAQILMSRDGVALEPGTRAYARSWIRDGAMMVAGLVRMGEVAVARDFVDWFARYVFDSGKVPCCVDARGADPVSENDSDGEYLHAVAEVWRYSGDAAFLARHWAVAQRVVAHLESLRRSTRTEEFRAAQPGNLWGLLPPSISHEGYSDKAAYSYWDDFWAVRGYKDAVDIALALGQSQVAAEWVKGRDELEDDLARSVEATAARFGMDTIAGAADRGDFDPTSTTAALNPAQARVSPLLLQRTFDRYWEEAEQRRSGARPWREYTPYELRTVGALVRLGHPRRAQTMLQWFLRYRRPEGWNQWAEVVMADPREPHFLGDMPHAWVASDYLRSVLDMFAYEREADGVLVLGAGLSEEWMAAGIGVKNLSTRHGSLTYRLSPVSGGYVLELAGGIVPPAGGVRLAWPLPGPRRSVLAMSRGAPRHLANAAGLSLELNRDGGVRRIQFRDDVVNLFMGNGMEPGPTNLWLRLRRGARIEAVPLLGPRSPLRPTRGRSDGFQSRGEWKGLGISLRLVLAEQEATWCWQVRLQNRSSQQRTVDLIYAQDLALASRGAVRLNEHYVSHYIDFSPMEHARCGWVVAARQNLEQGGRHPWAVVGSLRRGTSFATDGLQLFGLAQRLGGMPAGVRGGLPAQRLQHEHAMAAVQDERVTLAPGAGWAGGFFVALEADHPLATSAEDLGAVDAALSWAGSLERPSAGRASKGGRSGDSTLFAVAPLLECRDLDEAELRRLFPPRWRHEERDGAELLSFFCDEHSHVVLRAKEARTQRPHGHILRTGQARMPEESSLTSTVWMSGVFHSMVTQGHVSINRFLSTAHSWLGLFRSHGLRVFVLVEGRWQLLGVPSAFEMRPGSCRWIYRHAHGALSLTSAAQDGAHVLSLRARVLDGPPLAWLATLHVALGGDDGNASLSIPWRMEGKDVVVGMPEGSDLHGRFPEGAFVVAPLADTALAGVHGDGRLFTDGKTRGLPFLVLEGVARSAFGLDLLGRLVPDVHSAALPPPLPRLSAPGEGAAPAEVGRLAEMLPWFLNNAMVHYLAPRGLEQYSGGGWGTRDVCQGPLEMLLALDCPEAARDLLLRVFAAQNEDGDWPQWFQFIERERELRARDSHGDIVFWPLLAAARYVLGTGDTSLLEARVPFHCAPGGRRSATVLRHVDRALGVIRRRRVAGTALAAYGHGDWNDSLQPADPAMRERLCSTWTVILHHQTLTTLARAMKFAGHTARAVQFESEARPIQRDLRKILVVDGVLAGYVVFSAGAAPEPLLHPRDRQTGVRHSLLPMMHAILEDLCTPEEASAHLALMREHLWAPDGARLFDRPLPYRGGVERLFQRAETSAFFGREVGLLYTHAHLRYAEMQAHVGDARGLLQSLALAHPVQLRERLPQASLRQANCYFSSSDAAFGDRYGAQQSYAQVAAGTVALDGGWRVYSSGPGIALSLIVTSLLGVRREGAALIIDPVIAPELSGLRAEVFVLGRRVQVEYRVDRLGYSPQVILLNGRRLTFERVDNPYRAGGAAIPLDAWAAQLRADAPDVLRVELS